MARKKVGLKELSEQMQREERKGSISSVPGKRLSLFSLRNFGDNSGLQIGESETFLANVRADFTKPRFEYLSKIKREAVSKFASDFFCYSSNNSMSLSLPENEIFNFKIK